MVCTDWIFCWHGFTCPLCRKLDDVDVDAYFGRKSDPKTEKAVAKIQELDDVSDAEEDL